MKSNQQNTPAPLTGEQVVQKKLEAMNKLLKKIDVAELKKSIVTTKATRTESWQHKTKWNRISQKTLH